MITDEVIRRLVRDITDAVLDVDDAAFAEAMTEAQELGAERAVFDVIDDAHRRLFVRRNA